MNKTLSATLFFTCTLPMVALAADNCSTHRNSLVDNADYNIWSTVICPHRPVAKHTHAHPRVLIPHDNGTLRVTYADKPLGQDNPRDLKLEKDKPIYLDYNEGKDMHTDEVLGDSPLTVLVVELKTAQ